MKKTTTAAKGVEPKPAKKELRVKLGDPGFTPALRDAAALVALLADADEATVAAAEKALVRLAPLGEPAWRAVAAFAEDARAEVRAGVLDALVRIDAAATVPLAVRALADAAPAVKRRAIAALGKQASGQGGEGEEALGFAGNGSAVGGVSPELDGQRCRLPGGDDPP